MIQKFTDESQAPVTYKTNGEKEENCQVEEEKKIVCDDICAVFIVMAA